MGKLNLRHRGAISKQRMEGLISGECNFFPFGQNTDINTIHVLANGPSLWESASNLDQNDFVITVNFAYRDERILALKPNYHVMVDPCLTSQMDVRDEIMNHILKKQIENLVISPCVYNAWFREPVNRVRVVNTRNINYAYDGRIDRRAYEKNHICPIVQTVPIVALYIAVQLNPKVIFLHGNDFDIIRGLEVGMDNHVRGKNVHFYASALADLTKDYGLCLQDELESEARALKGYRQIEEYARDKGITIYNTSKKSMIDVFERTEDWTKLV